MDCPYCGSTNKPNARFCATCGYILASGPPNRLAEADSESLIKRRSSRIRYLENTKRGVALVTVIVIVVIVAGLYVLVNSNLYRDPAFLTATLYYRITPGDGTTPTSVHVWGHVSNLGGSKGGCHLTIIISDGVDREMKDRVDLGSVPANDKVDFDKTYTWTYAAPPLIVSYSL